MSPAPANSLDQVSNVLQPTSNATTAEKISVLQAFNAMLKENLSMEKSAEILNVIPLGLFYYAFSVEDDRLTTVLCELIGKILHPFTYDQIVSDENKPFLIQGLTHFTPEIRYLSLQQVYKCLQSDAFVSHMVASDVFPLVTATIAFQDTRTANKASDLLYKIAATTSGQVAFFGPTCVAMLKQLLQINGTISFRVYDLIIKVAVLSDATFQQCESTGLLSVFIKELQSDDLLVKINAIDLLNEIATTSTGFSFLDKANLLDTISIVLDNSDDKDVIVQLVKCAVLKFFGNLGENKTIELEPMFTKYHILNRLENSLQTSNIEILIVALSTVGLIGSHTTVLQLLIHHRDSLLQKFFEIGQSSVGQVKGVFLQSLSKLIAVRDERENEEIEKLTFDLYNRIQDRPCALSNLIKEAKQPEDSIRVASFAVMQAIAYHAWGSQIMAQSNEFMDYILNRSTEYTEQGQAWKYAIVQTLSSAPDASRVFGSYYARIQVYIRQGAYYRTVEPVAAVENS